MNRHIKNLILSAFFLSLCIVLPFLTGQIPQIGSMLSPMHIPVFICGMVCGWQWGLAVGFTAPLLRWLMFGMPPMPTCIAMAVELAVYGVVSGLLYKLLPKKFGYTYISLIGAMIIGRFAWGGMMWLIMSASGSAFTFSAFIAGAVLECAPGIILHILLIPIIILILQNARLISNE